MAVGRPITQAHTYEVTRWAKADRKERAKHLISVVERLRNDQKPRRTAAKKNLETYLGRSIAELGGYLGPVVGGDNGSKKLTFRIAQSVCDTAKAKIASKQRPKPVVVTSGGNYAKRQRAKKKSKFLEAQLRRNHGPYCNAWEITEQAFADCTRWEAGVLKVVADTTQARPVIERCFCYDLYFDLNEAVNGSPKNLFHVYGYDRLNLCERFPEHREEIMRAEVFEHEESGDAGSLLSKDQVAVYEGWRLPYGPDAPGKHTIAISTSKGGHSAVLLADDEWDRDDFPFAFVVWEPHAYGVWGNPLVEQIELTQQATNDTMEFINEKVHSNSTTVIAYNENAVDEDQLQANDGVILVPKQSDERALEVVDGAPFHPGMFQWGTFLLSQNFESTGVNEMGASGKSELGANASGAARRVQNQLNVERFLPKSRAYENLFPKIGKLMLWAMEDLAVDDQVDKKRLKAQLVEGDSFEEFEWEDVKLDDYEVTMQPASSFPDTPAARLELISELSQNGWIGPQAARRLISQTSPDVEAANEREDSNHRYMQRLITRIQEYDPDNEEQPAIDKPDPLLDLAAGILEMTLAYREMKGDQAPEGVLRLARNWITQAVQHQQQMAAKQAAAQAPPMPPGGGQPMPDPALAGAAPPQPSPMPMPVAAE